MTTVTVNLALRIETHCRFHSRKSDTRRAKQFRRHHPL